MVFHGELQMQFFVRIFVDYKITTVFLLLLMNLCFCLVQVPSDPEDFPSCPIDLVNKLQHESKQMLDSEVSGYNISKYCFLATLYLFL